jgi:UDP:flavonoid glycosyltransferase YjiC (YdhE family)
MDNSKNVLIAPLNWGLGHASRCIPIIKQQISQGNKVIIASDGESLILLQRISKS